MCRALLDYAETRSDAIEARLLLEESIDRLKGRMDRGEYFDAALGRLKNAYDPLKEGVRGKRVRDIIEETEKEIAKQESKVKKRKIELADLVENANAATQYE